MVGEKPGAFHYEMNPADVQSQLLAVRNAKEYSDFVMFTMHVHENRYAYQAYSQDHYPPDYLVDLVHQLVDNGMDMYVGHGNHTMQGIEIYKGRPIFYNHGNFSVQRFGSDDSPPNALNLTNIEAIELGNDWLQQEINLTAYVAKTKYVDGKLVEIRIYPVDLGADASRTPWSRSSIPHGQKDTDQPSKIFRAVRDENLYREWHRRHSRLARCNRSCRRRSENSRARTAIDRAGEDVLIRQSDARWA